MFVTPQVKARVEKVVAECVQKANKHFGRQYRIPRIEYTVPVVWVVMHEVRAL